MFYKKDLQPARGLLIDASQLGVLRFAIVDPMAPDVRDVQQIDVSNIATFTDALQLYAQENSLSLRGLHCVMAVASVTCGDTITVGRTRWTIVRSGLGAIFGHPVKIINNVAARAWALNAGNATFESLRGRGAPNFRKEGRYAMINVDQGVGCAVIDVDGSGRMRILETEPGHTDFFPTSDVEARIAEAVKGSERFASWEKMLVIDRHSPAWSAGNSTAMVGQRHRFLAALLGRFAVNLVNVYGAWQGVLITGHTANLLKGVGRSSFDAAFHEPCHFSRLVSACPAWQVEQKQAVLTGAAQCLGQDIAVELRTAA